MIYRKIGTKYCEKVTEIKKIDGVRCQYKDYTGKYLIGSLSEMIENPKLTDRKIGNGTHIFELEQ